MDIAADLRSILGAEVSAVTLDYRVSLQLLDPDDPLRLEAWLVIGVPFDLQFDDAVLRVDGEHPPTLEPAWRLLRRRIVSASADADLNLHVGFDNAVKVAVERNDLYEAWELHGKGVGGLLAGPR